MNKPDPPQSQLCSSISACSKRTLRYVAKNSTRSFISLTKQYAQLHVFNRESSVIYSERLELYLSITLILFIV